MKCFTIFALLFTYVHSTQIFNPESRCTYSRKSIGEQSSAVGTFNFMEHYKNLSLENIEGEIWKPIETDSRYWVSNFGRIKSFRRQKEAILKQDSSGRYLLINIRTDKKNFKKTSRHPHRIVALTFIPNPYNYPCVNHKNSNRFDNTIENLEWTTHKENVAHSIDFGFRDNRGENNYCSKLKNEDIVFIRENHHINYTVKELAKKYSVSLSMIYQIIWETAWKKA